MVWLAAFLGSATGAEGAAVHWDVRDGGALYRAYCAYCHGSSGRGDGPGAAMLQTPPRNLRDGVLARYDVDTLVRMVRDGAPLPLALDPAALRRREDEVETLVGHLQRLPRIDWDLVERGEEIYLDRCETCHGPYGRPGAPTSDGAPMPRDLSDPGFQRSVGDRDLREAVRHGRPGMRPFADPPSDDDTRALVAFVRILSPGYALYGRYCAGCHGEDGLGDEMVDPGRAPRVAFDRAYFTGRDPERLRLDVWHMLGKERPSMPHFRRRLDDDQARAIILYLKGGQ